jgi:hypothetical protein
MGDRSPKSTQKQASQKQSKVDASNKKKSQSIAEKQAGALKKKK